ncbi:transferase family protein [Zymoseptoria brevis]|uniref:Transferase family protein n=1 Tax=Zymoseptoria brevis TaxID=1047168 RepID=A0A0F4GTZ1_9PEZI|nr:transferase family protein [Zymoseptoria brevis]
MKTKITSRSRILPATPQETQRQIALSAIDAWYTYRRSLPTIYFFQRSSQDQRKLASQFVDSLSKTLDIFPHLAGTVEPHSIDVKTHDDRIVTVKRPRLVWGSHDKDAGVEFLEAETSTTLEELLPPLNSASPALMWDRSGVPMNRLFPKASTSETLVRVQLTFLQCGGFTIAVDMDHGLADAHVVGLFMQYWSAVFGGKVPKHLPPVNYRPDLVARSVEEHPAPEEMIERAAQLTVRRPLLRDHPKSLPNLPAPLNGDTNTVKCMLHLPATTYNRITQNVQAAAGVHTTDQVAAAGFFWAAMNRARRSAGYAVDLHMAVSFRHSLGIPDGTLGSPAFAVMLRCSENTDSAAKLAATIMETLSQYDENAMRALIYQIGLEDSPDGSERPKTESENMFFSSAVRSGWSSVEFGSHRPVFLAPLLVRNNMFVMVESLDADGGDTTAWRDWYRGGVNIFFDVPEEVYEAMVSDPAFADFKKLRDM